MGIFEGFAFMDYLGLGILAVLIVFLLGALMVGALRGRKKEEPEEAPNPVAAVVAHEEQKTPAAPAVPAGMMPAPGSSGEVALHTVDDRTAALLMCIVADDLGCEPNTLTFKSIRELA